MGWLVRKATLHGNSLGCFKSVDYMVAWLSLGYVNSGVFRFRLGCWSPGSCLYLTPARSLVNQRTDWISFFLPPPPAAFSVPALFFLLSKPSGLRTVGRQAEHFELSSEDQELFFFFYYMDVPHRFSSLWGNHFIYPSFTKPLLSQLVHIFEAKSSVWCVLL